MQKEFEKRLIKKVASHPDVIRFMRKVVNSLNYDVTRFKSLPARYYASLEAFELDVLKRSGFSDADKMKMIENGKIDDITEKALVNFLAKNSIEIPNDLQIYSGLSTLLVQLGQAEVNKVNRNRQLQGLESNAQMLVGGGIPDAHAKMLKERREYILDYRDEPNEQHFLKIGQSIRKALDKRQENKAEKKVLKNDLKIARINARQDAKTERAQIKATGRVDSSANTGGVFAQIGGALGNVFGGGGEIPQYDGSLQEGSSNALTRDFVGASQAVGGMSEETKSILMYGGLAVGAIVLLKVLKVF